MLGFFVIWELFYLLFSRNQASVTAVTLFVKAVLSFQQDSIGTTFPLSHSFFQWNLEVIFLAREPETEELRSKIASKAGTSNGSLGHILLSCTLSFFNFGTNQERRKRNSQKRELRKSIKRESDKYERTVRNSRLRDLESLVIFLGSTGN